VRSFVLSDIEFLWCGFIVDLNAQEMLPFFERLHLKAKVTAYGDDAATVHEAWHDYRTIVTVNEAHFIRHILEHQKKGFGHQVPGLLGFVGRPSECHCARAATSHSLSHTMYEPDGEARTTPLCYARLP
jgi:hypothetical protein